MHYAKLKRWLEPQLARVALSASRWTDLGEQTVASLKDVAKGRCGLVGPSRDQENTPRGLLHQGVLCELAGMPFEPGQSDVDYVSHQSLRNDLAIVARYTWVRLTAGKRERSQERDDLRLFGVTINNGTVDEVRSILAGMMARRWNERELLAIEDAALPRLLPFMVFFVNAHNLNLRHKNAEYFEALRNAHLVMPDGIGVRIAARMMGTRLSDNLNGTDLLPMILEAAEREDLSVFMLGAEQDVLDRARRNIEARHPNLRIAGTRNGFFAREDEPSINEQINASGADVVIVGMGTPRQELWAGRNRPELNAGMIFCMGGILDFMGGKNARAPQWMREAGFEWIYRIVQEPRRMWKRYVVGNPEFLLRAAREARRNKTKSKLSEQESY